MARVSVVIPAYNAAPWIEESVRSMLGQSYRDLEVIVVDDGSTDNTREVLARIEDPRLRTEANPQNLGLIGTLNRALPLARGEIIARMDADDVSPPERIAEQMRALEERSDVQVVSSRTHDFTGEAKRPVHALAPLALPTEHDEIVATLPFLNSVSHATALFRRAVFDAHCPADGCFYDASYPHAEDYELWSRLARRGVRFANLPRVHLLRRVHPGSVSIQEAPTQLAVSDRVRGEWRLDLGLSPNGPLAQAHYAVARRDFRADAEFLAKAEESLLELLAANRARQVFREDVFARVVARHWWSAGLSTARGRGLQGWSQILSSPLLSSNDRFSTRSLRLMLKSLLPG